MPIPTYHAHENGERSLVKNAALYSRQFRVGVRWLLYGEPDDATTAGGAALVKVVGIAGEGMAINPSTWTPPPFPPVPAHPQFPDHQQVAFQVSGNSAGEFARDGTYLICVPYAQAQRRRLSHRRGSRGRVPPRPPAGARGAPDQVPSGLRLLPRTPDRGAREPIRDSMTLYLVVAQYRPIAPSDTPIIQGGRLASPAITRGAFLSHRYNTKVLTLYDSTIIPCPASNCR